jgi:hypothetical protein
MAIGRFLAAHGTTLESSAEVEIAGRTPSVAL